MSELKAVADEESQEKLDPKIEEMKEHTKEIDTVLARHNCYVDGYVVASKEGIGDTQVGVVPFRVAGESTESQAERVDSCKSDVQKYLGNNKLDWEVKALLARGGNQMVFSIRKVDAEV